MKLLVILHEEFCYVTEKEEETQHLLQHCIF